MQSPGCPSAMSLGMGWAPLSKYGPRVAERIEVNRAMRLVPLTREEVRSVVEGRGGATRIPVLLHQWTYPDAFAERAARVRAICDPFPQDAQIMAYRSPDIYVGPADDPEYRWMNCDKPADAGADHGLDEQGAIRDWSQLDGVIAQFPSPDYPGLFPSNPPLVPARDDQSPAGFLHESR